MRRSFTSPSHRRHSSGGFVLVLALGLMAFVLLLLLLMTTLVRVESQGAAIAMGRLRAEQNALLGLNLAIGELQKHAGRDQTITARADLITDGSGTSSAAPETSYYTGVWNTQTETFGKWLASAADATGQLNPSGLTGEEDVNAAPSASDTIALKTMSARDPDTGSVDSVDVVVDQVSIGSDGSYAYWVSDEGIKVKVDLVADEAYYAALATGDEEDLALRTPLGAAPGIGFELLDDFPATLSASDKRTDADFRAKLRKLASPQDYAHLGATADEASLLLPDVTTVSYGLLTNAKSGGLKEDLSLAFEHGIKDSGNVFVEEAYEHPDKPMDVKGPTWSVFQDHYNLYKQMNFSNGIAELQTTRPKAHGNLASLRDQQDFYKYRDDYHTPMKDPIAYQRAEPQSNRASLSNFELPRAEEVQVAPVLLANAVIVSLHKKVRVRHDVSRARVDQLHTYLQPVAIMWNPYNVALRTSEEMKILVNMNFGLEFRFHDRRAGYVYKGRARTGQIFSTNDPTINVSRTSGEANLIIPSGDLFAPGEIKLYANDLRRTTGQQLRTVKDLRLVNGQGYQLIAWRRLSGGYDARGRAANLATRGYGTGSYDDVTKLGTYDSQGLIIERTVDRIDMALSPTFSNYAKSGLYPSSGGANGTGPFYQKRHVKPLSIYDGPYADEPEGIFSAIDAGGGEIDTGFVNFDIDPRGLRRLTPVGIFFNSMISSEDINNALQTPSAMELHLSANPRACFSASTVGTYAQFHSNPSTLYEAQEFLGWSTLDSLFFDDRYPHFGMSYNNSTGQNRAVAWEFPLGPLTSLAQLQHVFFNRDHYEPSYAVGNSFASPYLRRDESISSVGPLNLRLPNGTLPIGRGHPTSYQNWTGTAIDYSYKLNEALWDGYFLSSLAPLYEDGSETQDLDTMIDGFTNGTQALQNSRMQLYLGEDDAAAELATNWKDPDADLSAKQAAANLLVEGAFNVNSTSVQAWKAFLGSLYQQNVVDMELADPDSGAGSDLELKQAGGAVFSRFTLPTLDTSHPSMSDEVANNSGSGYRVLDADELDALAVEMVKQVKLRGPFLSLADFVNRDLATGTEGLMGPLQQAIIDAGLNDAYALGLPVDKGGSVPTQYEHDIFLDPGAGTGNSYGAGPGYLLQGDILNSLGPFLTVKSNTFVIRSCGEALDPISGETSRVYLEAVLQQVPDFIDSSDGAETPLDQLSSVANQQFGRKFKLVQVRRLDPEQI